MVRRVGALMVFLLVFAGGSALANHPDPHSDDANRCDTWYRDGYDKDNDGTTHDGPGTEEPTNVTVGGPDNTKILVEGGHYVVHSNSFYVEVAGGQDYRRPNNPTGARGGYVQGEVDHAMVPTDVDFLVASFLGAGSNSNITYVEKDLCLNVGNQRIVNLMDCTKPPKNTTANCN